MFGKSLGEPFSDIACMDLLHWLVLGRHYEPVRAIIMTWSIESWLMWALIWSVLPPLPYLPASSQPPEKISCSIWRCVFTSNKKTKKHFKKIQPAMGEIRAHSLVRASADEEGDRFWSQPWSSQLIFTCWYYFSSTFSKQLCNFWFWNISSAPAQSNDLLHRFHPRPRHLLPSSLSFVSLTQLNFNLTTKLYLYLLFSLTVTLTTPSWRPSTRKLDTKLRSRPDSAPSIEAWERISLVIELRWHCQYSKSGYFLIKLIMKCILPKSVTQWKPAASSAHNISGYL